MTYAEQFAMVDSEPFRGRIQMALMSAATNIKAEDQGTAEHTARVALANALLNSDPHGEPMFTYIGVFTYACASNATIAAAGPVNSPDGDLDFVIASNWTLKALEFVA